MAIPSGFGEYQKVRRRLRQNSYPWVRKQREVSGRGGNVQANTAVAAKVNRNFILRVNM